MLEQRSHSKLMDHKFPKQRSACFRRNKNPHHGESCGGDLGKIDRAETYARAPSGIELECTSPRDLFADYFRRDNVSLPDAALTDSSAGHRLHNEQFQRGRESPGILREVQQPQRAWAQLSSGVTVAGPVDSATGMVFDLAALDGIVTQCVLDKLDHKNLNLDMDNFRTQVPTTEFVPGDLSTTAPATGADRAPRRRRAG